MQQRAKKYAPKQKVCPFCSKKAVIDYKDVSTLKQFISDRGKIEPRRKTFACAKHQHDLTIAIKRARFLALLPYTIEHIRKTGWK